jgi:thioredoxin 1
MAEPIDVTDATFDQEVLKSQLPTVVDYWADWCGPCKQLSPILDQLANDYDGKVKFVKVDADANTQIATSQGILGLPTVQIYRNGEVVKQFQGGKPRGSIVKMIDEVL